MHAQTLIYDFKKTIPKFVDCSNFLQSTKSPPLSTQRYLVRGRERDTQSTYSILLAYGQTVDSNVRIKCFAG